MKGKFSKTEMRGLPGGPNEQFTYVTGVFMQDMYHVPMAQKGNGENVDNLLQSIYSSPGYRAKLQNEILQSKNINKDQIDEIDREYYSGDKYDVIDLINERINRVKTTPVNEITGDETAEWLYGTMSPSFLNKEPDYLDVESIEEGDRLYKEYYSKKQPVKTEINIYKDNLKNLSDYKSYLTEEKEHSSHIPLMSQTPLKGYGSNITPYAASIVDENIIVKNDYLNDPTETIAKKRATETNLIGKNILMPGEMVDESHFKAILNSDDMSMNIADLLIGVSGVQYKDTPEKTIQHVKKQIKDNPDLYKKSLSRWLNIMNKIAMQDQGQDMYYGQKGGEGYRINVSGYNDPYKVIPSGNITMTEQDGGPLKKGPLLGIDNMGNQQMMFPGYNYVFPGDMVMEIPVAQKGIESKDAMMKNAIARNSHIPFVKRLTLSQKDSPSLYLGEDEEGYDMYGSHQLASFGNYVLPNIVQEGTTLKQISKDANFDEIFKYHRKQGFKNALYFDNPEDAKYFAEENYKRVSPAFQKQKGGEFQKLVNKYTTKGWQSLTDQEKQTYKQMYQQYK